MAKDINYNNLEAIDYQVWFLEKYLKERPDLDFFEQSSPIEFNSRGFIIAICYSYEPFTKEGMYIRVFENGGLYYCEIYRKDRISASVLSLFLMPRKYGTFKEFMDIILFKLLCGE